MGRKTNGGLEMTSNPFKVDPPDDVVRAGVAATEVSEGDGDGDSLGLGEGEGVTCGPWSAKFAQGLGGTLAHRWCTPGGSPENGFTLTLLKLPFWSAVAEPATWFATSQ
jgi:hypothetical protein